MKNLSTVCLFFALFCLSACSFKSLVAPNFDYLITRQMTKHMDLASKDRKEVRRATQKTLEKNKALGKEVKARLAALDIRKVDLEAELAYFNRVYFQVAQDVNVILAAQISQFNEQQARNFFENLEEENQEIEEKLMERDAESYLGRYEYFFGELSESQVKLIKKNLSDLKELAKIRVDNRRKVQAQLKEAMKLEGARDREREIRKALNEVSDRRQPGKTTVRVTRSIQALLATLTEKQAGKFEYRKKDIIDWIDSYLESDYISQDRTRTRTTQKGPGSYR